jgi:RNA polymerase sigma-70 factor (ECF subfamily)
VTSQRLTRQDVTQLYLDHAAWLVGYGCSLLRDRSAAEDIVQQVFARLLRGDIVVTTSAVAYLCQAVRNSVMTHRRTRTREVALNDGEPSWLEARSGSLEAGLAVEAAVQRLPEEQREVVVLRVWGQLTFLEIAEALELSPNTVASRYRYGLTKLRDILRPLVDD